MRKIAKHAVSKGDEWHMKTDNARTPRLTPITVEGRASAIRGMPVVEEEDAKAIVSAIRAMRGADKKKHKETFEQGTLKLPVNKLPMQWVVQTWRQACGKGEVWNDSHNSMSIAEEKLKRIFCPECRTLRKGNEAESEIRFQ